MYEYTLSKNTKEVNLDCFKVTVSGYYDDVDPATKTTTFKKDDFTEHVMGALYMLDRLDAEYALTVSWGGNGDADVNEGDLKYEDIVNKLLPSPPYNDLTGTIEVMIQYVDEIGVLYNVSIKEKR